MIAACLGLEAVPMVASIWTIWTAIVCLKMAVRSATTVRCIFLIFWSTVCTAVHALGFLTGAWGHVLLKHTLTVSTGLVVLGWCLVANSAITGVKEYEGQQGPDVP
jgi:hypothetical protein